MTFIATCLTYSGLRTIKWLRDQPDFWSAVEAARFLSRPLVEMPLEPQKREGYDHDWRKECTRVQIENDSRVKEVVELRPFM